MQSRRFLQPWELIRCPGFFTDTVHFFPSLITAYTREETLLSLATTSNTKPCNLFPTVTRHLRGAVTTFRGETNLGATFAIPSRPRRHRTCLGNDESNYVYTRVCACVAVSPSLPRPFSYLRLRLRYGGRRDKSVPLVARRDAISTRRKSENPARRGMYTHEGSKEPPRFRIWSARGHDYS